MTITVQQEQVTPEKAEEYLKLNRRNRRVSEKQVLSLAAQMESGQWQDNGETIKFDTDGSLCDGQHRLFAITLTGLPVTLTVVRGVNPDVIHTIDNGRPRRAADALTIEGYKSTAILAAAGANLWRILTGATWSDVAPSTYVITVNERYPAISAWAARVMSTEFARRICAPAVLVTALTYLSDVAKRPDLAERLLDKLDTGEGLSGDDPISALRNRLISFRSQRGSRFDMQTIWPTMARVITALEDGETMERVQIGRQASGGPQGPKMMKFHLGKMTADERLSDLRRGTQTASSGEGVTPLIRRLGAKPSRNSGESPSRNRRRQAAA